VSRTNSRFEGITGLHSVDPTLSQNASMKEGVPGPVGEFDEAKALLGIKPFDDAPDRRTGGGLERGLVEPVSGAEGTGLWVIGINVKVATPRMTKILISQFVS
jgi:hypothetical protein